MFGLVLPFYEFQPSQTEGVVINFVCVHEHKNFVPVVFGSYYIRLEEF